MAWLPVQPADTFEGLEAPHIWRSGIIDGQPQYMGLMGHPLADSYQSLMAERVEAIRVPLLSYTAQCHGWRNQYHYQTTEE